MTREIALRRLDLVLVGLVALAGATSAHAHGGPEKVAGDRIAVSLALSPAGSGTRLLFRFRDMRTGAPVAGPLVARLVERDPATGASRALAESLRATRGVLEVVHAFSRPGLHEVLIEFEREDEPGRVYRPEDWLVDIPSPADAGASWSGIAGLTGCLGALAAPALYVRLRRRHRDPARAREETVPPA